MSPTSYRTAPSRADTAIIVNLKVSSIYIVKETKFVLKRRANMIDVQNWSANKSDNALLWMYCLDQPLSEKELESFNAEFERFSSGWNSHGADQTGSCLIVFNQLVLISTETTPSGCSIDSLRQWVNELAGKIGKRVFTGQKLVFITENSLVIKERSSLNLNDLPPDSMWVNTGLSNVNPIKNGTWLRIPSQVF